MSVVDEYVTVAEAAELLGVSRSTLWRWIDRGELPAYRLGRRRVLVRRDDLEKLITPARTEAPAEASEDEGMTEIERIKQELSRPWSEEKKAKALAAFEAAQRFSAEMHRRRGGKPFSDSTEIIREMREERTRQLMGDSDPVGDPG